MGRQYSVRRMTSPREVSDAAFLGQELHKESNYAAIPYHWERAVAWGMRAINTPNKVFGAVAYTQDKDKPEIVGFMGAHLSDMYFCDASVASDMTLYVHPLHRGSTIARRLIKLFEQWADEQGAAVKMLSISTGINTERTLKFYERLGYKASGFMTTKMEK